MRAALVCVGKLKERYWREACAEYEKRLARYASLEILEVQDAPEPAHEGAGAQAQVLRAEGERVVFVIGGSLGLSPEVYARANERLSFSTLTFPHQMMRVVFLEQLYRACRIQSGERYHK